MRTSVLQHSRNRRPFGCIAAGMAPSADLIPIEHGRLPFLSHPEASIIRKRNPIYHFGPLLSQPVELVEPSIKIHEFTSLLLRTQIPHVEADAMALRIPIGLIRVWSASSRAKKGRSFVEGTAVHSPMRVGMSERSCAGSTGA